MTAAPALIADRYRLMEQLGVGGMGRVWRARDETLHRDVAVKQIVLPPELLDSARDVAMERTLREARAAARLSHPNVVRVYDVLAAEGHPWLVMEYVPARSLDQVIRADGPLDPRRVAEIGLAVLDALQAAHRAGVDHRDIKPGNVLLSEDGRVVLTDFGIARVEGEGHVTRTGLVLGSPEFIAPERAREGLAGPAGDLWSLGATLYTAVEGHSPFGRGSAMETLTALASEEVDPPQRAGALAPALSALLRKDPRTRAGFTETADLLRSALTTKTPPPRRRSWRPAAWRTTPKPRTADPTPPQPTPPQPTPPQLTPAEPALLGPAAAEPTRHEPAHEDPAPDEPTRDEPTRQVPTRGEPADEDATQPEPPVAAAAVEAPAHDEAPAHYEAPTHYEAPPEEPVHEQPATAEPAGDEAPPDEPAHERPTRPERPVADAAPPTELLVRLRRHRAPVGLAVGALLVVGLITWLAVRPGRHDATPSVAAPASGVPTASPTPETTATASPSAAPTTPPSSAAPSEPPAAGGGLPALPPGWVDYHDPTGFSVYVPAGWNRSKENNIVYFRGGGRVLGIDQTDRPKPDPVADWRNQANVRVARGDFKNYVEIHIQPVQYFTKAADWEFTFDRGAVRQHANNRGVITSPTQAYGFYWQTSDADWAAALPDLQLVFASFRPRQ